nr:atherin-like [Chlorocebus sabaeus]
MMESPSSLTRRGPKSYLKRSPETPAEALKLPLHGWKSAQGGPEDRTPGVLVLGCPRRLLPRRPLLEPGSGGRRGLQRPPPAARHPPPPPPTPLPPAPPRTRPLPPLPRPGAPRSRGCLKGPRPDFQLGSASGPGAAGPVRMLEARAASRVTEVPTVVLETGPLRLGKAGALRGGARVSGLRGSCLTSPRGRRERLRTDAGSRNAPARMTKPQAESGGSGASSQPQACPDGVGVSLGGNFWRVGWC